MLARIRIAPVRHVARIKDNVSLATVLLLLPVRGQPKVPVHRDRSHASHKAIFRLATTDQVIPSSDNTNQLDRSHWSLVHIHCQLIIAHGQHKRMPLAVVKLFLVVVNQHRCQLIPCQDLHFHLSLVNHRADETPRSKVVVEDQSLVLVRAEPEGHVQLLHALVTLHLGVGLTGQEGDWNDWGIRTGILRLITVEAECLSVVISLLHLADKVGLVQVQVLKAARVVLEHADALLDVRYSTDVELKKGYFDELPHW